MANRYLEITLPIVAAAWLFFPAEAVACEMCFGSASDSETIAAIVSSMLILVVLTGVIGGGVFAFFRNMANRARRLREGRLIQVDKQSHLRANGHHH